MLHGNPPCRHNKNSKEPTNWKQIWAGNHRGKMIFVVNKKKHLFALYCETVVFRRWFRIEEVSFAYRLYKRGKTQNKNVCRNNHGVYRRHAFCILLVSHLTRWRTAARSLLSYLQFSLRELILATLCFWFGTLCTNSGRARYQDAALFDGMANNTGRLSRRSFFSFIQRRPKNSVFDCYCAENEFTYNGSLGWNEMLKDTLWNKMDFSAVQANFFFIQWGGGKMFCSRIG